MKKWRIPGVAILMTVAFCSAVLLRRHLKEKHMEATVRRVIAKANAGLNGKPDADELLRTNAGAVSLVGNALAGVNDYLWAEEELLKGSKDVTIPVDVHVQRILFGVTGTSTTPDWTLTDPHGQVYTVHSQPPLQIALPHGRMIRIVQPLPGPWIMHFSGKDNIFLFARASSNTGFDVCEIGPDQKADIQLSAEGLAEARFRVLAEDGSPLSGQLEAGRPRITSSGIPGRKQYRYSLVAPKVTLPFRFFVASRDLHGHPMQRVCDSVIQPTASR